MTRQYIGVLELSKRAKKALLADNNGQQKSIRTIKQLINYTEVDLLGRFGLGRTSLREIINKLRNINKVLKESI